MAVDLTTNRKEEARGRDNPQRLAPCQPLPPDGLHFLRFYSLQKSTAKRGTQSPSPSWARGIILNLNLNSFPKRKFVLALVVKDPRGSLLLAQSFCLFVFETRCCYVAQVGLEFMFLFPPLPDFWGSGHDQSWLFSVPLLNSLLMREFNFSMRSHMNPSLAQIPDKLHQVPLNIQPFR